MVDADSGICVNLATRMIIYNITTLVSWPIHNDWKEWMINEQIPQIIGTQLFTHHRMVKLLEVNEDEGPTYALQLYISNLANFNLYREKHLEEFRKKEKLAWGELAISFASLMEVIN